MIAWIDKKELNKINHRSPLTAFWLIQSSCAGYMGYWKQKGYRVSHTIWAWFCYELLLFVVVVVVVLWLRNQFLSIHLVHSSIAFMNTASALGYSIKCKIIPRTRTNVCYLERSPKTPSVQINRIQGPRRNRKRSWNKIKNQPLEGKKRIHKNRS